jgi:hypothetical protein
MLRARSKRLRTPRIHELRGSTAHASGTQGVRENWSLRSDPHRLSLKRQGVYLLHAVGTEFYKIGVAIDVESRRKELQCGTPFLLELIYFFRPIGGNAIKIEGFAHAKAREQKRGSPADNEYFRFSSDDEAIAFIQNWDFSIGK